ncbi:MAG TPA: hypothetical protein VMP01_02215, partial [Pirellulaceae bacterium]|nr:hypothetical protein [Pirellulaceae bacterium]
QAITPSCSAARKCDFILQCCENRTSPLCAGRIAGPLVGWFGTEDAVAMRRPVVLPVQQVGASALS